MRPWGIKKPHHEVTPTASNQWYSRHITLYIYIGDIYILDIYITYNHEALHGETNLIHILYVNHYIYNSEEHYIYINEEHYIYWRFIYLRYIYNVSCNHVASHRKPFSNFKIWYLVNLYSRIVLFIISSI